MTEDQEEYIPDIENGEKAPQNESGEAGERPSNDLSPWDQVKQEWSAPLEKRALMVRSVTTVTRQMVELATEVARRYGLPISGVNIISSKAGPQPYINSDGITWRLHMDKRGFKSTTGEVVHMPTEDEPYIIADGLVEMNNGASSKNQAIVDWPPTGKNASFTLGDLCMKAITKAQRRAGAKLVGVGLPVYDEYYEQAWEVIEGDYKEIETPKPPPKESPDTKSELITMANERYGLKYPALLEFLEVPELPADLDIEDTWNRIKEHYAEETTEDIS